MKTSNKFTLARIIAAPILFVLYFLPRWLGLAEGAAASLLLSAAMIPLLAAAEITDYFDGSFARAHGEVSDFGKMFDPFADVFLHLSMFTCFVFTGYMHPALFVLILYREFSQNFLRMVAAKSGTAIAAKKGGKIKTVFYVASCFVVLVQNFLALSGLAASLGTDMAAFKVAGNCVFAVCVLLSYASFIDYLKSFGGVLKDAAK
ncbi:MAG: CDP-diacylglycerol--glycerol-3-phosphate 3-phosphatidyltransferase [Treponema sp.]|nr:CDP-diacylglycerol--glycerol-3-phosphate 3-phosphatidyltransferase [Treponema sp.]